ncbi:hypothetical protein [Streptomyces purpurascens]|uniref:hypothetical protein n=1 Tax=Streptomyces purpurascens TaxID=1924 RepID=UPI0016784B70|nr:hypothetical protein [Streptomyces purpurascens]MCE7051319.1 hypothetical protein [Streptomyces purpurascens]GHA52711.1 hypothetical protein GCM10010303_75760 [Streptomyces purpurascens]
MNENLTLDGLAVPLRALRLLAVDFSHLPAPDVQVSPIFPNQLQLSFHSGLPDFEVWREALGISPDTVVYREQSDGRTRVLKASADFAGAVLELTGYSDVCVPEPVGGAA